VTGFAGWSSGASARGALLALLCPLMQVAGAQAYASRQTQRAEIVTAELPDLVVTIIDPEDPHLSYMYHRELDAILAALNAVGFVQYGVTEKSVWPADSHDGGVGYGSIELRRWSSHLPAATAGIAGKPRVIAEQLHVLLVPETQNGGVNQAALHAALTQAAGKRNERGIYVLGPVLSGSAWSLEAGLRDARSTVIDIVTGSANASDLPKIFGRLDAGPPPARQVRFSATVHTAGALAIAVRSALCAFCRATMVRACGDAGVDAENPGDVRYDLALFVETSSFYGQSFLSDAAQSLNALVLPFPAQLSEHLGEDPFGEKLPDSGTGRDDSKSDAVNRGPGSQREALNILEARAALDELLRTVAFENIHTVGILATDVRDRILLAQKIRRFLPGVRVVLFESDLLYSKAPDDALRGTVVASTYPLFPENQSWTSDAGPGSRRLAMASDPAEGAYNATLLLLRHMDPDGGLDEEASKRLLEYQPPGFAGALAPDGGPPIWISVLGVRGSWPLVPYAADPSEGAFLELTQPADVSTRPLQREPTPFRGLVALTILGAFVLGALVLRPAADGVFYTIARPNPDDTTSSSTNFMWLAVLAATSLLLFFEAFVLCPPNSHPVSVERPSFWCVFALVVAIGLPTLTIYRCVSSKVSAGWGTAALALGLAFVLILALMIRGFSTLAPEDLALFLVRATHIESGLSPIPPLLIVYIAVLVTLFTLLSLEGVHRIGQPSKSAPQPSSSIWKSLEEDGRPLRIGVGALLAVGCWYLWGQFRPLMEIQPLGLIFRVVFTIAPITLSWIFVLVLQTGWTLRRVLDNVMAKEPWIPPSTTSLIGPNRRLFWSRLRTNADVEALGRDLASFATTEAVGAHFDQKKALEACCRAAAFIRRGLVRPLFVTPLLMIAIATYPFEPHSLLLLAYGILLALFMAGTLLLMLQIENHPGAARLLSNGLTSKALTLPVVARTLLILIPALLTLIGTGVPATGQKVFGWLDQLLSLLK
jgi:hypothetical protein